MSSSRLKENLASNDDSPCMNNQDSLQRCNILIFMISHHPSHANVNTYPIHVSSWVEQYILNDVFHNPGAHTNRYSFCVHTLCDWKMVAYQNVTPDKTSKFVKFEENKMNSIQPFCDDIQTD